jgi:hypothetical protein
MVFAPLKGSRAVSIVVHHHAERVDVGEVRGLGGARHELGRHVRGRAHVGDDGAVRHLVDRGAEVGDLDLGAVLVEDVAGLEVAVREAERLREGERAHALEDDLGHLARLEQRLGRAELLERAALDVLHHDVAVLALDHGVVDLDDVRVVELAGEARLVEEHALVERAVLGALERLGVDQLERDLALGERVVAQVHLAAGALAELGEKLVFADRLPGRAIVWF